MKNEFLPYHESSELELLGFTELCLATIDQTEFLHINATKRYPRGSMFYITTNCPLFQQVFNWFRITHNLNSHISNYYNESFTFEVQDVSPPPGLYSARERMLMGIFDTYEEAQLAGVRHLIKLLKNKRNEGIVS